jgi:DNA (cytosine-5)-methyltransferase 1
MTRRDRTVAEFFSGIGLVRVAFDNCGWRTSYANDIDPEKCEIYRHNFPDADQVLVEGDVHKLTGKGIPTVTLATASFPCNDLSLAGSWRGIDGAE